MSLKETIEVASAEINGAIAYEISGIVIYFRFIVAACVCLIKIVYELSV